MNKSLFTIAFTMLFLIGMAQVEVGVTNPEGQKRSFKPEELRQIKRSETIFLIPGKHKDMFENSIKEIWSVNDYKVLSHKSGIQKPKTNEIVCSVDIEKGENAQRFNVFLEFRMDNYNSVVRIAAMPIFIKQSLRQKITSLESDKLMSEMLYTKPDFYNFSEAFLKANLKVINNRLSIGKPIWFSDEIVKHDYISELSSFALDIPEYCILKPNMITGEMKKMDKDKLFKKYPHNIKIIQKYNNYDRFLLLFAQTGNDVYVSIYDKKNSQIIYQEKKNNQFFLNRGDFKDISKCI